MFKALLRNRVKRSLRFKNLHHMFIASFITLACTVSLTPCYAQQIITDGNTATSLNTVGTVTDVTTTTTRGTNAFNSFTKFNVDAGKTVNLVVPNASDNLINLVTGQQTQINGVLNSVKNGNVGGNIFLANPNGIVIGTQGVVNVGSITAVTPTADFTNNFFNGVGDPNDASVSALIDGSAPIDAASSIDNNGKINAITDVKLSAGSITNAGEIYTDAVFGVEAGDVVNLNSLDYVADPDDLVLNNGNITITGNGTINSTGDMFTGGDVNVNTGGNVDVEGTIYGDTSIQSTAPDLDGPAEIMLGHLNDLDITGNLKATANNITVSNSLISNSDIMFESPNFKINSGGKINSTNNIIIKANDYDIDTTSADTELNAGGNIVFSRYSTGDIILGNAGILNNDEINKVKSTSLLIIGNNGQSNTLTNDIYINDTVNITFPTELSMKNGLHFDVWKKVISNSDLTIRTGLNPIYSITASGGGFKTYDVANNLTFICAISPSINDTLMDNLKAKTVTIEAPDRINYTNSTQVDFNLKLIINPSNNYIIINNANVTGNLTTLGTSLLQNVIAGGDINTGGSGGIDEVFGDITAGGNINLTSGGTLWININDPNWYNPPLVPLTTKSTISAGGDININSNALTIDHTSLLAGGNININSDGISIDSNSLENISKIDAIGNVSINAESITINNRVDINPGADMLLTAPTINLGNYVNIITPGNITVTGDNLTLNAYMEANGNVVFSRATAGDIEISDTGMLTPQELDRVDGNIVIGNHADTNSLTNNIDIKSNVYTDGDSIEFNGGGTITVNPNVVVSTRDLNDVWSEDHLTALSQGNSGSVSFTGSWLNFGFNSKVITTANNGYAGGNINADIDMSMLQGMLSVIRFDDGSEIISGDTINLTVGQSGQVTGDIDIAGHLISEKDINLNAPHGFVWVESTGIITSGEGSSGQDGILLVNADGSLDPSGNMTTTTSGNNINVNDFGGSAGVVGTININGGLWGTGTLEAKGGSSDINITNNSTKNLTLNDLTANSVGQVIINGTPVTSYGDLTIITGDGTGLGNIDINNTASNIYIAGNIEGSNITIETQGSKIIGTGGLITANNLKIETLSILDYFPLNIANSTTLSGPGDHSISGKTGSLTAHTIGFFYKDVIADSINVNSDGQVNIDNGTVTGDVSINHNYLGYDGPAEIMLGHTNDLNIGGNLTATATSGNIYYYGGSVGGNATFNSGEAYNHRISTALGRYRPLDITGDLNVTSAGHMAFVDGSVGGDTVINAAKMAGLFDVDLGGDLTANALAFGYFKGNCAGDVNVTAPMGALFGVGGLLNVVGNVTVNSANGPVDYYLGSVGGDLDITADSLSEIGTVVNLAGKSFTYDGTTYDINDLPYPIPVDDNNFTVGGNLTIDADRINIDGVTVSNDLNATANELLFIRNTINTLGDANLNAKFLNLNGNKIESGNNININSVFIDILCENLIAGNDINIAVINEFTTGIHTFTPLNMTAGNEINITTNTIIGLDRNGNLNAGTNVNMIANDYVIDQKSSITAGNNVIFSRATTGDIEISDTGMLTPQELDRVNGNIVIGNHADTNSLTNDIFLYSNIYRDNGDLTLNSDYLRLTDGIKVETNNGNINFNIEEYFNEDGFLTEYKAISIYAYSLNDTNKGNINLNTNRIVLSPGSILYADNNIAVNSDNGLISEYDYNDQSGVVIIASEKLTLNSNYIELFSPKYITAKTLESNFLNDNGQMNLSYPTIIANLDQIYINNSVYLPTEINFNDVFFIGPIQASGDINITNTNVFDFSLQYDNSNILTAENLGIKRDINIFNQDNSNGIDINAGGNINLYGGYYQIHGGTLAGQNINIINTNDRPLEIGPLVGSHIYNGSVNLNATNDILITSNQSIYLNNSNFNAGNNITINTPENVNFETIIEPTEWYVGEGPVNLIAGNNIYFSSNNLLLNPTANINAGNLIDITVADAISKSSSPLTASQLNITANNIINYLALNIANSTNITTTGDCLISGITGTLTANTGGLFTYNNAIANSINLLAGGLVDIYTANISGDVNIATTDSINYEGDIGGTLTATGSSVDVTSEATINVNQITADNSVVLNSTSGSILDARPDETANIITQNIGLYANNGSIGTLTDDLNIELTACNLDAQANEDINLTINNGSADIGVIESYTGNVYLKALNGSIYDGNDDDANIIANNAVIEALYIGSNLDLNIANSTNITTTGDCLISGITGALTANTGGDFLYNNAIANSINLLAGGLVDIYAANVSGDVNIATTDSINYEGDIGGSLTASGSSVDVTSHATINVNQIIADNSVVLNSTNGSILDARPDETANIIGQDITLTANNDSVGTISDDLNIELTACNLDARANDDINLSIDKGSVNVGLISANNVILNVNNGDINSKDGSSTNIISQNATIQASGSIDLALDISGELLLYSEGDINLIGTLNKSVVFTNGALNVNNITGHDLYFGAMGNINADNVIVSTADNSDFLEFLAGYGDINLTNIQSGYTYISAKNEVNISNLTVREMPEDAGLIIYAPDGTPAINNVISNGTLSIRSEDITLNNVSHSGKIIINGNNLTATDVLQQGILDSSIETRGSANLTDVHFEGNINIDATDSINYAGDIGGTLTATGSSVDVTSQATINVNQIIADNYVVLNSTNGSILDARPYETANIITQNIGLYANNGSIGTLTDDINIELTACNLDAQANDDINLTINNGSADIGVIESYTGNVYLKALNGSIYDGNDDNANIIANNAVIEALSIGISTDYLESMLAGSLDIHTAFNIYFEDLLGDLDGNTILSDNGSIYLNAPDGAANISHISALGDISVTARDGVNIDTIDPANINLQTTNGGINVNNGLASNTINLIGDIINVKFSDTDNTSPLSFNVSGATNKWANNVTVNGASNQGINFNSLYTVNAIINNLNNNTELNIYNAEVTNNLAIKSDILNATTNVDFNNVAASGTDGNAAESINILNSKSNLNITNLDTNNAYLATNGEALNITNAIINDTGIFAVQNNTIIIHGDGSGRQNAFDVFIGSPKSYKEPTNISNSNASIDIGMDTGLIIIDSKSDFASDTNITANAAKKLEEEATKKDDDDNDSLLLQVQAQITELSNPLMYLLSEYQNYTASILQKANQVYLASKANKESDKEALAKAAQILKQANFNADVSKQLIQKNFVNSNNNYINILKTLISSLSLNISLEN